MSTENKRYTPAPSPTRYATTIETRDTGFGCGFSYEGSDTFHARFWDDTHEREAALSGGGEFAIDREQLKQYVVDLQWLLKVTERRP